LRQGLLIDVVAWLLFAAVLYDYCCGSVAFFVPLGFLSVWQLSLPVCSNIYKLQFSLSGIAAYCGERWMGLVVLVLT
jgi:hypothetical protein